MLMKSMERFEKSLTKTDIQQRLAVPTDFVTTNFLVDGAQLAATDFTTSPQRIYRFELSIRKKGGYTKPVFQSKEWLRFVKDNCLDVGDTVHFWKQDNERFGIAVMKDYLSRC